MRSNSHSISHTRKRRQCLLRFFITLCLFIYLSLSSFPSNADTKELMENFRNQMSSGDTDAARKTLTAIRRDIDIIDDAEQKTLILTAVLDGYIALKDIEKVGESIAQIQKNLLKIGPDFHTLKSLAHLKISHAYQFFGDLVSAAASSERALENYQRGGKEPPHIEPQLLDNKARILIYAGYMEEAEKLINQTLAIRSRLFGVNHPSISISLNDLAAFYLANRQFDEAERALNRSREIALDRLPGTENILTSAESQLGQVLLAAGKPFKAIEHFEAALSYAKKNKVNSEAIIADIGAQLSKALASIGNYREALKILDVSIQSRIKTKTPINSSLIGYILTYAEISEIAGLKEEYTSAAQVLKNVLDTEENLPTLIGSRARQFLIKYYADRGNLSIASRYAHEDLMALEPILVRSSSQPPQDKKLLNEFASQALISFLTVSDKLYPKKSRKRTEAIRRGFVVTQLILRNEASESFASSLSRRVFANNEQKARYRRLQDLKRTLGDKQLTLKNLNAERAKSGERTEDPNPWKRQFSFSAILKREKKDEEEGLLLEEISSLDAEITEISRELASNEETIRIVPSEAIMEKLSDNEALLAFLFSKHGGAVWSVRKSEIDFDVLPTSYADLAKLVAALREDVDFSKLGTDFTLTSFDIGLAHTAYKKIFGPIEKKLGGITELTIIPHGPLQKIPLSILVSKPFSTKNQKNFADVDWLINQYAFSYLPSIQLFGDARGLKNETLKNVTFLGIGDPFLSARTDDGSFDISKLISRGGVTNPASLAKLPSLPSTRDELSKLSELLTGSEKNLLFGKLASESKIKSMDLSKSQVIAFATHALVAGEVPGIKEPGLVLSIPDEPSSKDDGYLTANEIATLKLDADLVILSACNTASSSGQEGATQLSGLAASFLYAGVKSLLVSHWYVETTVAPILTTNFVRRIYKDGINPAQALQSTILSFIREREPTIFSHPAFWAPFVYIGGNN
jgi:CHAT domain-containing protein